MAYDGEGPGGYDGLRPGQANAGQPPHIARQSEAQRAANAGRPPLTCTALVGPASRCGRSGVVRDFTTALYPDGPAIRLCSTHVNRFHLLCINATVPAAHQAKAIEAFERACDSWRWAPDCVRV